MTMVETPEPGVFVVRLPAQECRIVAQRHPVTGQLSIGREYDGDSSGVRSFYNNAELHALAAIIAAALGTPAIPLDLVPDGRGGYREKLHPNDGGVMPL